MDHVLAALDAETMGIIAGVAVGSLVIIYFGVRFWLVSTRPAALQDVKTPNIDRLNKNALEHMAGETLEEDEAETAALQDEDSPEDLKAIIPPDAADKAEKEKLKK